MKLVIGFSFRKLSPEGIYVHRLFKLSRGGGRNSRPLPKTKRLPIKVKQNISSNSKAA